MIENMPLQKSDDSARSKLQTILREHPEVQELLAELLAEEFFDEADDYSSYESAMSRAKLFLRNISS